MRYENYNMEDKKDDDLYHFINTKSISSFDEIVDDGYITNRVKFILDKLTSYNIEKDIFFNKSRNRKYINLYYYKDNGSNDTIVLLAHHDINNPKSMNANDNSASIINLINLIKKYNLNLSKNILITFTDAEEIVDIRNNGAYHLGEKINRGDFKDVKLTINLELTAHGKNIWYEHDTILNHLLIKNNASKVSTPFNDSHSLRKLGIPSVCIGIVEDEDVISINKNGYCDTWGVCHKENDSSYDLVDMNNFVDVLYDMIKKL